MWWQEAEGAEGRDSGDGTVLGEPTAMASAWGWGQRGGGSPSPSPTTGAFHSSPSSQSSATREVPQPGWERPGAGQGRGETEDHEAAQALVVPGRCASTPETMKASTPEAHPPHWGLKVVHRGQLEVVGGMCPSWGALLHPIPPSKVTLCSTWERSALKVEKGWQG